MDADVSITTGGGGGGSSSSNGGRQQGPNFKTSMAALAMVVVLLAFSIASNSNKVPAATMVRTSDIEKPEHHRQVQLRPKNVNILIMGNSTAHYGYLSLVYYLRWGRWFDPGLTKSNLVNERSFDNPFHNKTFNEFYYQTNVMLQPWEMCDCHKNAKKPGMRRFIIENRYFHDPTHNNTVTYIHAYGDEVALQGRLLPNQIYTDRWKWSAKEKGLVGNKWHEPDWQYARWHDFVNEYVTKMPQVPDYIVMQAGRFKNTFGPDNGQEENAKLLKQSISKSKVKSSIWQSTAYDINKSIPRDVQDIDSYMCKQMDLCYEPSFTKNVKKEYLFDEHHFHEPVYRIINEELLEMMRYLPDGYVKYDKTKIQY